MSDNIKKQKRIIAEESVPVEHVVNTVGAGDSYFAGFISGIIDGKSIQECMRRGAEQSAKVISTFNPYL